jgi:hypothetical protein
MAQRMMPWITPLSLSTMSVLNVSNGKEVKALGYAHFHPTMTAIHRFLVVAKQADGNALDVAKAGTPTPLQKYSVLTTPNNI